MNLKYNRFRIILCLILFQGVLNFVFSQHARPAIYLPNNAVLYTYQDEQGFMWFGTYDGLSLYNGKQTISYRHDPADPLSLCSNTIYKIMSAEPGYIWITTTMGLNKFSLKTRKMVAAYPKLAKVVHLAVDTAGDTWMMPADNLLLQSKPQSEGEARIDSIRLTNHDLPLFQISAFFIRGDAIHFLKKDGTLVGIPLKSLKQADKTGEQKHRIHTTKITKTLVSGTSLYITDELFHLYRYDFQTKKKRLIADLQAFIPDDFGFISQIERYNDHIYIALKNSGILRISESGQEPPTWIQKGVPIFCLFNDPRQDLLWIGTDGQGVKQHTSVAPTIRQFNLVQENLSNKPVRAILTDSLDNLWIGTNGDGLLRFRQSMLGQPDKFKESLIERFTFENGLQSTQVFGLAQSRKKDLIWIGTENGLFYYSYAENKVRQVVNRTTNKKVMRIHSIKHLNDSTLWLSSTTDGLIEVTLVQDNKQWVMQSAKNHYMKKGLFEASEIHSMVNDGGSRLMVGSRGQYGVAWFDMDTYDYQFLPVNNPKSGEPIGDILSVWKGNQGSYYLGSSTGLTHFRLQQDKVSDLRHYTKKDGLLNDMIHGILADDQGFLWLSSSRGLIKHNSRTGTFHNYSNPSFVINEFSDDAFWKCPQTGSLFFGAVNGFVAVNPAPLAIRAPQQNNNFHFFDVQIGAESFPLSHFQKQGEEQIAIPTTVSAFSVSFIALDYLHNNYTYSYKLEGYHDEWISLENENQIDFIGLPPGSYILKVRYKDDVTDGNEKIARLPLIKLPPWYLSQIAFAIYFFILLGSLLGLAFFIKKQGARKQQQALKEMEKNQKKELLESKLAFFTNITHEFYTPLTLIKGMTEILMKGIPSSEIAYKEFVHTLHENASELENLIKELLQVHDPEKSSIKLQLEEQVNVSDLLQQSLVSFRLIARDLKFDFEEDLDTDIQWTTDRILFHRILNNLVSNAFKYTRQNGSIRVSLKADDSFLKLSVYNTGKGIEAQELSTIFTPYQLLDHQDENRYLLKANRTGLGLAICRSMVEALSGEITVNSIPGSYTEFVVKLPVLVAHVQSQQMIVKNDKTNSVIEQLEEPRRSILLVDDHQDIVRMLSQALPTTYNILTAHNGEEAWKIISSHPISLIITDLMMPEKDGIQLIQEVRKDRLHKHIPIIVISAKTSEQQQEEGIQVGADVYLTKPFSLSLLNSHVEHLLNKADTLRDYYHSPESAYETTNQQLVHHDDKKLITSIIAIIDAHLADPELNPAFIADKLCMSPRTLYRKIKASTSLSLMDFIKDYRFISAERLLLSTNLSIQEIMYKVGLSNKAYFYREFVKRRNMTPKEFRKLG